MPTMLSLQSNHKNSLPVRRFDFCHWTIILTTTDSFRTLHSGQRQVDGERDLGKASSLATPWTDHCPTGRLLRKSPLLGPQNTLTQRRKSKGRSRRKKQKLSWQTRKRRPLRRILKRMVLPVFSPTGSTCTCFLVRLSGNNARAHTHAHTHTNPTKHHHSSPLQKMGTSKVTPGVDTKQVQATPSSEPPHRKRGP